MNSTNSMVPREQEPRTEESAVSIAIEALARLAEPLSCSTSSVRSVAEMRTDIARMAIDRVRAADARGAGRIAEEAPLQVTVDRMVETHRVTHCVQLRKGGKVHCIRQVGEAFKNRADYEAAAIRHVLGQSNKPRILDFPDPQHQPARALGDAKKEAASMMLRAETILREAGATEAANAVMSALQEVNKGRKVQANEADLQTEER